jgi:hypothetical protein
MRLTLWMLALVLIAPLALSAISASTAQGRIAQPDVTSDTTPKVVGDEARDAAGLTIEGVPWYRNSTWWIVGLAVLLVAVAIGWGASREPADGRPPGDSPPPTPG